MGVAPGRFRTRTTVLVGPIVLAAAGVVTAANSQAAAPVSVTVDATAAKGTISPAIGIVLCTSDSWPDDIVGSGDPADWNNTVLSIVGNKPDFGIVHWYPSTKSAVDVLASPGKDIQNITT